jgi:hypothetical protein
MKMGVAGHTHEGRLLSGYVQDVWDKFHKESVAMATRHRMEVGVIVVNADKSME